MKCLRCGAELNESAVFCTACSKVTSVPLPSSPYLNKKIQLPKRKPAQNVRKAEPKKPAKKETRVGRWILISALLFLLSASLLLQGVYLYNKKESFAAEVARLQSVEDECVRLTEMLRQAQEDAMALEKELEDLGTDSYLRTREELKLSQEENTRLTEELSRAQESIRDLESRLELLREKTEFFDTYIVFLQEDGTDYFHSFDCEKFIRHSYRAYNKQQALALGYLPCPNCH